MVFCKLLSFILVSCAVGLVLGSVAPAHAAGLVNNPLNTVTKTATTVLNGTPLGPSGPTGPNGPLVSMPGSAGRGNTGVQIGSSNPIRSNSKSSQLTGAVPVSRIKGVVDGARLPITLRKELQATVTSITNDSVTLATPAGAATLKLPPGTISTSGMLVGSKITVAPNSNGVSVQLRITDAVPKPYAGIYVGKIETIAGKTVSLRFRDGVVRTFGANPHLLQIIKVAKGKTVALASSDGLSARKLLTSKELDHVLDSIPKEQKRYIGRVVQATASAVTLDLGNGQVQTLQCSPCTGSALHGAALLPGLAVYVIGDQQGRLLNLAAIPNGTRIVGQIAAAQPNFVSIMLGSGDIVVLPCACTKMLQTLGDINVGDPFIVDLNQNAAITSLTRFPDNGRIIGQIVKTGANALDLKLPTGQVETFACNCLSGPFDLHLLGVGNAISVGLNSDAQVASIDAPSAAAAAPTASPSATSLATPIQRRRLPCGRATQQSDVSRAETQHGHAPCAQRPQREIAAFPPGSAYAGILTGGTPGCAGQDSSNILIGVHDGRRQAPVFGAAVYVNGPASITLMSPASGYIELRNVPSGKYRLRVRKAGFGEAGTAEFEVPCAQGVRVDASLRTLPQILRIIRMPKRQVALRTTVRQKQPLNCAYSAKSRFSFAKTSGEKLVYRTSHGFYSCVVPKARFLKTVRR